jgi:hypothetical protein
MIITHRQKAVLDALKERSELRIYELPDFVGRGTMAGLVDAGLVEVVPGSGGPYSKYYAWRLRLPEHRT